MNYSSILNCERSSPSCSRIFVTGVHLLLTIKGKVDRMNSRVRAVNSLVYDISIASLRTKTKHVCKSKRLHPIHCLLGRCFTDFYRLIIIVCLFFVFFFPRLSGSACCYSFALWRFRPSSQSRLIIRHLCQPPHLELTALLNLWLSAPYVPPTGAEKPIPRSSSTLR